MVKGLTQGHAARIGTRSRSDANKAFAEVSKTHSNVKSPHSQHLFPRPSPLLMGIVGAGGGAENLRGWAGLGTGRLGGFLAG